MKKINLLLVAVIGAISLTLTSCDDCKDVTCENGGTCNEGVCECPAGFSGDACETEDKCITGNVTCEHDGTCADGICTCTDGYEGDMCETAWSAKFVGSYKVVDGTTEYDATIETSSTDGQMNIIIKGVGTWACNNAYPDLAGVLSSGTDFTIAEQTYCAGTEEYTLKGSGSINEAGTVITMNYSGKDPGGATTYSSTGVTLTKK